MSFSNVQTSSINGVPYQSGVTVQSNNTDSNQLVLFQPTTGTTGTLNTSYLLKFNPLKGFLYTGSIIQQNMELTTYPTTAFTLTAAAMVNGIVALSYYDVITMTLDTNDNIKAAFSPDSDASSFSVFVCILPGAGPVTVVPPGDSSVVVLNTRIPSSAVSFTMYFVYDGTRYTCIF
jgi:hypothetical protein